MAKGAKTKRSSKSEDKNSAKRSFKAAIKQSVQPPPKAITPPEKSEKKIFKKK